MIYDVTSVPIARMGIKNDDGNIASKVIHQTSYPIDLDGEENLVASCGTCVTKSLHNSLAAPI